MVKGKSADISAWIELLRQFPEKKTEADKKRVRETLRKLLDGYVAMADLLAAIFVRGLLGVYPDAMVVCTVRSPDTWFRN